MKIASNSIRNASILTIAITIVTKFGFNRFISPSVESIIEFQFSLQQKAMYLIPVTRPY